MRPTRLRHKTVRGRWLTLTPGSTIEFCELEDCILDSPSGGIAIRESGFTGCTFVGPGWPDDLPREWLGLDTTWD